MGKQAQELQQLRQEREQLAKERDEIKAQTGKLDPEVEKKIAENAELRDAITAVNLQLLPEFRREFIEDRKGLVEEAKSELALYGGDQETLAEALALPRGRRRDEALELAFGDDITEVAKTTIRGLIAQIDAKDKKAHQLMTDPQNSFDSYQAKVSARQAKANEEAQTARQAEIQKVLQTLPATSPLLKKIDPTIAGAEEWNASIDEALSTAQKALGPDATLSTATAIAAKGARYDAVEKLLLDTRKELMAAKKQLAEYDGASPSPTGRRGPQKTGVEAELEKSPGQIYQESLQRAQEHPADV